MEQLISIIIIIIIIINKYNIMVQYTRANNYFITFFSSWYNQCRKYLLARAYSLGLCDLRKYGGKMGERLHCGFICHTLNIKRI
jgi:hypothetical protein